MKRIVSLMLCIAVLLSTFALGMIVSFAADEPTPLYYENFANKTAADIESTLVRNHAPDELKLAVTETNVSYINGASNVLHFQTKNGNNDSVTVFKLFDLPETVTDFAVYVRFSFTGDKLSDWTSWGSTSRIGLAYNIDGEIADNEHCGTAELRKSTSKTFRQNDNTYKSATSISQAVPGVTVSATTAPAEDTFYEMGLVVSQGKMYTYLNGKLVPLGTNNTTSIDYTKNGSGLGLFAAYARCYVDDFVVYDSAYVPAGYDSLTGTGSTIDDALAATVPALTANLSPDKVAAPVYYQNFATITKDELTADAMLLRNNSPSNLSVKVEPYFVGEETTGTNMMYFNTRNKNNDSHTVFKFYDLPETATNFAVYVKFAFSSNRTNWSTSSASRLGIVYNIADGKIEDGESVDSIEFTYNKEDKLGVKALRAVKNTFNSATSTSAAQSGQYVETPIAALDTFYELAIIVSEGKLYTYLNGKLMPLGAEGATSIDYTRTASGIGLFGAYTTCWIDDIRIYDSAYVADGYDALTASAFTGDACKEPLPALPATCVSDVQNKVIEEPDVPLGPAPDAGTVLYQQNFDNVTNETLGATVIKDSAKDFTWSVGEGTLKVSAPTSASSHGLLQLYELPKNVKSFTIVMDVCLASVADYSEKNLIGPAYSVKDDQNWSNLSLRANGSYNFTRQVDNNWVSNNTYPDGGSSRNGKYYSVEGETWYTLCMVVTSEGKIRSYINGILQPDNVPLIQDGYGIGVYIRNGTSYVDNITVYAGQYVPAGYDDISGEGSYLDDLEIVPEDDGSDTTAEEVTTDPLEETTKVEETTTKKTEETTADDKTDDKKGGCGAAIGTASICLVALLAGGALTLCKRKE